MQRTLFLIGLLAIQLNSNIAFSEPAIHPEEGLKQVEWQYARAVVWKEAFVCGKVINTSSAGQVNFLNFDASRPAEFTAVIFKRNLDKFPQPLKELYEGKIVRIKGRVHLYKDHPQIIVTDPSQIEILDEMPDLAKPIAPGEAKTAVEGQLTIATYNTLNMFDDEDDPYHGDEGTPVKPRKELQSLAQSIEQLNADVIAFQEVENRFYLQKFVDVFLPDLGYGEVVHFEGNDGRGIDVCLISRLPVGAVRSYRHLRFPGPHDTMRRFNRDILAVTIEPKNAEPFEVWVVHLKSNSGGREFSEPVRISEAEKLRDLLDRELAKNPEARFMVMGDFNDTWDSATLKTIVGEGSGQLWSAASELGDDLPDTYNRGRYQSMIDFILCSPAMAKKYVKGSFRVLPGSTETTGSDHNPVVANFYLE